MRSPLRNPSDLSRRRTRTPVAALTVALTAALIISPATSPAVAVAEPTPAASTAHCTLTLRNALDATLARTLPTTASGTRFGGIVSDTTDVWQRQAQVGLIPASVTKLLTAAAALHALNPEARQRTTVSLTIDGSLVLRGTGDITISRRPRGVPTFYRNAGRLDDLARQVRLALVGIPITPRRIIVDNSAYLGPDMAPGWFTEDIAGGSIAPIVPAMLDGARYSDTSWYGSRTSTPSEQLGEALARRLGLGGIPVEVTRIPLLGLPLGHIESATLTDRIHDMLLYSDNILAESIGREVALAQGLPPSFSGASAAVLRTLATRGYPTAGALLRDTSGLSHHNRLPARTVQSVLRARNAQEAATVTNVILRNLPVAGRTGTLRYRFDGANLAAQGHVHAKTGSLNNSTTLAGVVYSAQSGRPYFFAFLANTSTVWAATTMIDNLAATVYRSGC